MRRTEAEDLVLRLLTAYPRQQLRDGTPELYCDHLLDLDAGMAMAAVDSWVDSSPFFPTIADIRSRALPKGDPMPPEGHRWIVMDRTQDGELWQAECSDGWWYRFEGRVPVRDREARRSRS